MKLSREKDIYCDFASKAFPEDPIIAHYVYIRTPSSPIPYISLNVLYDS